MRPNAQKFLVGVRDVNAEVVTLETFGEKKRVFPFPAELCPEPSRVPGGSFFLTTQGVDPKEDQQFLDTVFGEEPTAYGSYPITIDYDRRLERMIADGRYDWKDSAINAKNFPVDGKGTSAVNIELVRFSRNMESDDVLHELDKQGLRPATLPELLAFGAKYPEKHREFPIVALGSVWRGFRDSRYVASLRSGGSEGSLELYWLGSGWLTSWRFAAVRK